MADHDCHASTRVIETCDICKDWVWNDMAGQWGPQEAIAVGHDRCVVCLKQDEAGTGVWAVHADLDITPVHTGECFRRYQAHKLELAKGARQMTTETKEDKRVRCAERRVLRLVAWYFRSITGPAECLARSDSDFIADLSDEQRAVDAAKAARTHARRSAAARKRAGR